MKQNVRNLKQQTIYRRRRTALLVALVLLTLLIVAIYAASIPAKRIANTDNVIHINGDDIDISNVISMEPNPPAVGAGMIPIKWNESASMWEITSKSSSDWYDYANGKWANVMLSDGKYQSELQANMTGKELAKVGTQVKDEELGSIYTWIPRIAYLDTRVEYLKGTSVIDYEWTTEGCFNLEKYGANSLDLAFEGIWVGQKEFNSVTEVENKNTQMNSEENMQGLVSNEKVATLTSSDKNAVEKLSQKYVGITANKTMIQNIDTMTNRQTIKIINTNKRLPIVGTHTVSGDYIIVRDKYSENGISYAIDKDGNKLEQNNLATISTEDTQYTFYLVDKIGNIRKYKMNYGSGRPDVTKFNKNTTFYVTYDENGIENSTVPIGEKQPKDWYNYTNQQWANIVVRDNGNENYYVWIPRYMYKLRDDESVDAKFVDLENMWEEPETGKMVNLNDTEYKLPEAFTWEDPEDENNVIQLTGFWASKYKLREGSTYSPDITGGSGVVRITNVVATIGTNYVYEAYLIKDGKRIVYDEETGEYIEGTNPITITGNYTFKNVPAGNYAVNIIVKDSTGTKIQAVANQVTVLERIEPNKPDTSSFNQNLTYYVTYDENGNEDSSIPVGEDAPSDWYDYDSQQWANIVVRQNGMESYYTWIPRYEYKLDTANEKTNVQFIPTDKETVDEGYAIPEAFTWEDPNDDSKVIQLSGFWASKYKLRDDVTYRLEANVTAGETNIKVSGINPKISGVSSYEISLIKDGKVIKIEKTTDTGCSFRDLKDGTYSISIIARDSNGIMLAGYSTEVSLIKVEVDLSEFNKNTTFYVAYDENGIEDSTTPIGENPPENWFDYSEQKWANIVVRDNGNENYYVWIPRYQYVANSSAEKVKAEIIPVTKETADPGYTIPEAFTWEDPNDSSKVIQLSGFWASKYKLREGSTYSPDISGGSGVVRITNVVATIGTNYVYEAYLIKDGKRIVYDDTTGKYVEGTNPITITGNYTFKNVPAGNYAVNIIVKDSAGTKIQAIANQVTVLERVEPEKPDLTGFNKNLTYYVTYNALGEKESYVPIGEEAPSDWYDYDNQQWANIVVRENGNELYYVWIPRYEYKLDTANEKTNVQFISKNVKEADEGYAIPEAFTWEDPNDSSQVIQLSGFWASKYKLRDDSTCRLNATVAVGTNKIRVSNIIAEDSSITYKLYLIKDGKRISTDIAISDEYTFTVTEPGTYAIEVVQWNSLKGIVAGMATEVVVQELEPPDLTGFMVDTTYIVTYDSSGNEDKTQTLRSVLSSDAQISSEGALISGKVDVSKINGIWYDYAEQKWANIVTINDGYTNYFTWIPRYEYMSDSSAQRVKAILIPKTKETADEGYTIPEAFTWEDPNNSTKVIQLSGFWASKYKLRS